MKSVTGPLSILIGCFIVIFSFQNRQSVDVSFLLWSMSIPKVVLILGMYIMGMLSGWRAVELIKRVMKGSRCEFLHRMSHDEENLESFASLGLRGGLRRDRLEVGDGPIVPGTGSGSAGGDSQRTSIAEA